jgi:hypothetical protein
MERKSREKVKDVRAGASPSPATRLERLSVLHFTSIERFDHKALA